jgi:release factor glutamine methyltransferase
MRLHLDVDIAEEALEQIHAAYQASVIDKKPLEYVLGHVDFFGVPFYVNEHTIIPRPETEYMITAVTEYLQSPLLPCEERALKGQKGVSAF